MSEQSKPTTPRKSRSGSEKRKMYPRITFRVDEALHMKADTDAAALGLTVGSYLRLLLADHCSTRPTRRPLPSEMLLRQLKVEAAHVDNNLNQIARKVNSGEISASDDLQETLQAVRSFWTKAEGLLSQRG